MVDKSGARIRALAAEIVNAVVVDGRSLDVALQDGERKLAEGDRPLLRFLCFGAIRFHWRLRAQLKILLDRPLKKKDNVIESLLAIGIYQLTDTRVPDHAAVSMTVDATKILRRPKFSALVNAILRNFLRRNIAATEPASDEEQFNHPSWIIEQVKEDWPERWQEILTANNERAPMWLRVNKQRSDRAKVRELLEGIEVEQVPGIDQALRLTQPMAVSGLPGFEQGVVSVQDGAAQLAAPWLLQQETGGRILDACAAPGGKTAHLLELAPDAELSAIDVDALRLESVRENLRRLGLHATFAQGDVSKPQNWWDGKPFERILLDAPCSASGVIRRHPDIKLLRRNSDLENIVRLQSAMLGALWPLLGPSGRMLYVTCSVLRQENDGVICEFLRLHPDASSIDLLPNNNVRDLMERTDRGYQILPGREGLDGFYFAHLQKTST
jgi:16S rRNA (cytosine967-C5)-methyltransferase